MLTYLMRTLNGRSSLPTMVTGLIAVGLIGIVDHLTGYELSFSIFYLVPVVYVTWHSRQWVGYSICLASSIVWVVVDFTSGGTYSNNIIPLWNAIVRLLFFLTTSYLLGELKGRLKNEQMLARKDGLTQVLNARTFREVTTGLLRLADRHHHPVVLGYLDIDNFKAVNDKSGHTEGDLVLQSVASTLTSCVRSTDVVGRLGGDEFAIFLQEPDITKVRESFTRIHETLVNDAGAHGWPIGFSIGVVILEKGIADIDEIIKRADKLMYSVKETGKNKVMYQELDHDNMATTPTQLKEAMP